MARLTIPFTIGTGATIGNDDVVEPRILLATNPVDEPPEWEDVTYDLRSYKAAHGREKDLGEIDPGTATLVMDDSTRDYDPDHNSAITINNRWWIQERFGTTYDVFKGYAVSYQETWVKGSDVAWTTVSLVDEMKRLNQQKLPTMNPPRDTFDEVLLFDKPDAFWPMGDDSGAFQIQAQIGGENLVAVNSSASSAAGLAGPIAGEIDAAWNILIGDGYYTTEALNDTSPLNTQSMTEFTIAFWMSIANGLPAAQEKIARGPTSAGTWSWELLFNTNGTLTLQAKNNSGTNHTVTSTTSIANDGTWYQIVGTITGGNLRLYINGAQESSTAWTGNFNALDSGGAFTLGDLGNDIGGAPSRRRNLDRVAFWRTGLAADRVLAQYQAGALRGARAQDPGARITAILEAIGSTANRSIRAGSREIIPIYYRGQPALDELRRAETGENVDSMLFVAADGTVTFLDDGHRSVSPWNTVQATFDDEDEDWRYQEIATDFSDAFIVNEYTGSRDGGTVFTDSDAASVSQYGPIASSPLSLPLTTDSDVEAILAALLAKTKDPFRRVTRLEKLAHHEDVIPVMLGLELGDRIQVIRNPPGGGSPKDQTAFIQKIEVERQPGRTYPLRFVLSISPL